MCSASPSSFGLMSYPERLAPSYLILLLLLLPAPLLAQSVPVAYWPLDAATGCIAQEANGGPPALLGPACPTNSPLWIDGLEVSGQPGGAVFLDGVDDHLRVSPIPALRQLEAFTIMAWVRHEPTDAYTPIIDQRERAADGYDLYFTPTSRLFLRVNNVTLTGQTIVADGSWHHVAAVYDGASVRLYVDGVLDRQQNAPAMVVDADADLFIGRHYSDPSLSYTGALDEVRIFDMGLSGQEVAALWQQASLPAAPEIVAYWPLDEGTGCTVPDDTGTWTAAMGPQCPSDAPLWVRGVHDSGLRFDGEQDILYLQDTEAFRMSRAVTVAAWIQHHATGTFASIVDHRQDGADGYDLYINEAGRLFMRVNAATLTSTTPVADGSWHHVAGVYDGTNLQLYIDGELDAETHAGSLTVDPAADIVIGQHYLYRQGRYAFQGVMDEVYVSNRSFTATEIAELADYTVSDEAVEYVYYVDAESGLDSNPGTSTQPFKTLQRCVNLWARRDALFVPRVSCHGRGVFHEALTITGSGPSAEARNQIIAWDTDGDGDRTDESFVLDGQNTLNVAIRGEANHPPANIEIAYLDVQNYYPIDGWSCGPDFDLPTSPRPANENSGFIHISGGTQGSNDWWIHHNTFRNLAVGCKIVGSMIAVRPKNAPRLIMEDNTFENLTGFIMRYFGGEGIAIRRNQFIDLDQGINVWNAGSIPLDGIEISDNTFVCRGYGQAITFTDDVQDGIVRGNTFDDCKLGVLLSTDAAFGNRPNTGHLIENNLITFSNKLKNNGGTGIAIRDCTSPAWDDGTPLHVSDVTIRNNVIRWLGTGTPQTTGIVLRSGHLHPFVNDFRIAHNTVQGMDTGMLVEKCSDVQMEDRSYVPTTHHLNGIELVNNIFANTVDEQFYLRSGATRPADFIAGNNVFSGRDRWTWHDGTQHRPYLTFSDWQTVSGQGVASQFCEPQFTAPHAFHVSTTDTCAVNNGRPLGYVEVDADGDLRPQGGFPDVGADEVLGAASKHLATATPSENPASFRIDAAYPNPFATTATLAFSVQEPMVVRVDVFDILGRRVMQTEGELVGVGRHTRRIDAANWPNGQYHVRLTAGERVFMHVISKVH